MSQVCEGVTAVTRVWRVRHTIGNWASPDIVEALQCLKCFYHNDLIFRDVVDTTQVEKDMEELEDIFDDSYGNDNVEEEEWSWDKLLVDDATEAE